MKLTAGHLLAAREAFDAGKMVKALRELAGHESDSPGPDLALLVAGLELIAAGEGEPNSDLPRDIVDDTKCVCSRYLLDIALAATGKLRAAGVLPASQADELQTRMMAAVNARDQRDWRGAGPDDWPDSERLFYSIPDLYSLQRQLIEQAERARREGLLSLEDDIPRLSPDFVGRVYRTGLQLVVDGTDPEMVRKILTAYRVTAIDNIDYAWDVWTSVLKRVLSGPVESALELLNQLIVPGHPHSSTVKYIIGKFIGWSGRDDESAPPQEFQAHPLLGRVVEIFKSSREDHVADAEIVFQAYRGAFGRALDGLAEGILAIQSGDNPRIVRDMLHATTGVYSESPVDSVQYS